MAYAMITLEIAALCCCAFPRSRSQIPGLLLALLTVIAMVDAMLIGLAPRPAWALALVVSAVIAATAIRGAANRTGVRTCRQPFGAAQTHRLLCAVAMAPLLLTHGAHETTSTGAGPVGHQHGGLPLTLLIAPLVVAVIALGLVILVRDRPRRLRLTSLRQWEPALMSLSLGLMLIHSFA